MSKKKQGHYCKICGRHRANEKFSGKGHRQHICKDCKRSGRKAKKVKSNKSEVPDGLFESDENFTFIAGYTESGFPYGITVNEPDYDQAFIALSKEIAEKLKNIHNDKSLEKSIHTALALSLFVTKKISIERAAYLMGCQYNDFIHLLQTYQIPWCIGEKDGHEEYRRSMDDLLITIDILLENEFYNEVAEDINEMEGSL